MQAYLREKLGFTNGLTYEKGHSRRWSFSKWKKQMTPQKENVAESKDSGVTATGRVYHANLSLLAVDQTSDSVHFLHLSPPPPRAPVSLRHEHRRELKGKNAIIPQRDIKPSVLDGNRPSNRVILVVIEGLRWDIFNTRGNISKFSTEIKKRGKVGPIYVNVPSARYRGLIRMITGVPGDDATNQTANVFHSARTVYIGPSSLGNMLNNINRSYSYPEAWENLTVGPKQTKGDEWVFETWYHLLSKSIFNNEEANMFFFYLNGFDLASQLDGPLSYRALKELKYIFDSLEVVYSNTEKFFPDSKTSYIVTSDYGFVEGDEDAENSLNESMVPLITWGAGLAGTNQITAEDASRLIRKGHVRQVDLAPFISYLIGTEIPFNNFGDAPIIRLSKNKDRARSLLLNAKQLAELFLSFEKEYSFGLASFCSPLDKNYIDTYLSEITKAISNEDYYLSISRSQDLIDKALNGIGYYRNYESNILWICALISLVGWTLVTLGWVAEKVKVTPLIQREMVPEGQENVQSNTKSLTIFQRFFTPIFAVHTICFVIFCITTGVLLFISAPLIISLAAILATTISWLAAKCSLDWFRLYKSLALNNVKIKKEKPLMYLIYFVVFTCFLSYPIVVQIMLSFAIMFSALSDLRYSPGQHLAYWMLSSLSYLILLHYSFNIPYLPVLIIAAMLSSHASLINFALIPESSITLYNQLMFLFSLLMRPLAYLFLMPSVLSMLIGPIPPQTTQSRSPEIIQPITVETSL
ncbi:unnamed protein product [Nezara viridula]|uniref:GPI ethanolamine phosphate transferase 1 n=1 Tax=Nezara viridula TaxID=85310 RepID=A0A9P0MSM8_NEZVI|nr:unnamed protein product [Nezara viridula]